VSKLFLNPAYRDCNYFCDCY